MSRRLLALAVIGLTSVVIIIGAGWALDLPADRVRAHAALAELERRIETIAELDRRLVQVEARLLDAAAALDRVQTLEQAALREQQRQIIRELSIRISVNEEQVSTLRSSDRIIFEALRNLGEAVFSDAPEAPDQ